MIFHKRRLAITRTDRLTRAYKRRAVRQLRATRFFEHALRVVACGSELACAHIANEEIRIVFQSPPLLTTPRVLSRAHDFHTNSMNHTPISLRGKPSRNMACKGGSAHPTILKQLDQTALPEDAASQFEDLVDFRTGSHAPIKSPSPTQKAPLEQQRDQSFLLLTSQP